MAVPSLAFIRQSVTDWTREFLAHDEVPDWICVCSDETVGNLERDDFVGEVYELGLPTHTDPKEIATLLRVPSKGSKIVFTTYQSSDKLAAVGHSLVDTDRLPYVGHIEIKNECYLVEPMGAHDNVLICNSGGHISTSLAARSTACLVTLESPSPADWRIISSPTERHFLRLVKHHTVSG